MAIGAAIASAVKGATIGDVFVIPLENHNFTQPSSYTSIQQIKGNVAAPYINSLITPGNVNASNVSYATNYTNSGTGVHPSEPNYIWAEGGTNYDPSTSTTILSDNDPSAANKNIFTNVPHLTGLMNAAGVSWKNYQEDYQVSGKGALVTASGTLPGGATNPYDLSTAYSYAPKHDPMAFYSDTATQNLAPISQLATDLTINTVGRYNWITPDLYNDMHTALTGGFTYRGTHYTGDQAAVAQGDNFLSIVIPEIEASTAFKNNGMIVVWNDETEGGDTTNFTATEIVISPLAKGNGYASSVAVNHSSDIKTMQEIFGLGPTYLNNTITSGEYSPSGGSGTYNTVSASNDLSDLFQPGVINTLTPVWTGGVGNWSTAAKWASGVVPNNPAIEVRIDGGNAAASVVWLDQNASVADVIIDSNDSLIVNAGQTLTLNGPAGTVVNGSFNLSSAGLLSVAGTFTNQGTTTLSGTQTWLAGSVFNNGGGVATFASDAGAAGEILQVNAIGGKVVFNSTQHLAGLNVSSGALVQVSKGGTSRSIAFTPNLAVAGVLDLEQNDLDVQSGSLSAVDQLVMSGFNLNGGSLWAGSVGITSSAAAADTTHLTALGAILNNVGPSSPLYGSGTALGLFDGANPAANDVLVRYTYFGDSNLDGKVDGSDYSLIDNGFLTGGSGWYNGDFNYDGVIDGSDYTLIDNAFNSQGNALVAAATITSEIASGAQAGSVPEPSAMGLLAIGVYGQLARRSRRSKS